MPIPDPAFDGGPPDTAPPFKELAVEKVPILNTVGVPALTAIVPDRKAAPPVMGFGFAPVPGNAVVVDAALALPVAEALAPSVVVTVTFVVWLPCVAEIPANTTDRVCLGSSGPKT